VEESEETSNKDLLKRLSKKLYRHNELEENDWFSYYVKLLANVPEKRVQILDYPKSLKKSSILPTISKDISMKLATLQIVLKLMQIDYTFIDDISKQTCLLIPTCSFFHDIPEIKNALKDSYFNLIEGNEQGILSFAFQAYLCQFEPIKKVIKQDIHFIYLR
jgi:hypothetical protein